MACLITTAAHASGPSITSLSPNSGAVGSSVTITGSGFGSSRGSNSVKFNTTTVTTYTSWANTSIVVQVPTGATTGNVTVKVGSATSNGLSFTVTTGPTITSISPSSNLVGGSVTISGSGFGSTGGSITFNGTRATLVTWGASSIVAAVPFGATSGNVVVTTAGGVSSNAVPFTVTNPTITSVSPASAAVGGGVTISGNNFTPTNTVLQGTITFNGVIANVIHWGSTSILATVPQGATSGPLVVTDAFGNPSNSFNFTVIAPNITAVTPSTGSSGAVTITGTMFGSARGSVTMTGIAAPISSWIDTQIVVTIPAGISTGDIIVTDAAGNVGAPWRFQVTNPGGIAVEQIVSGNSSDGSPVTPTFSTTSANELLLAFISSSGDSANQQSVTGVTGGGLTWERVQASNGVAGTAEIWRAFATTAQSNLSVTANLLFANNASISVASFTGVDTSGTNGSGAVGATASASNASGLASVSLTTTRNNSLVFAVGDDPSSGATRTPGPGQAMVHEQQCTIETGVLFACLYSDSMEWVQQYSTIVQASGTLIALNDTAPSGDPYNLAAAEILSGAGPVAPVITTLSPASGPVNTSVTITGTGFGAVQGSVSFAGLPANVSSWSDTTIVAAVPLAAPLGLLSVVVTANGIASNSANFTVTDITPPLISITAPADQSFTNNNRPTITLSYSDTGSGVDTASLQVSIDGVDHTAEFTRTANGATGAPVTALADGTHQIVATIKDLSANQASATASFTVVTAAPQITNLQPPNASFTNAVSVTVTGSFSSSAPIQSVTVNGIAATLSGNTFTQSAIALGAGPAQSISVVATDVAGNSAPATITLNIDRVAPIISATVSPAPVATWNNKDVTVSFLCSDDDSGVATCPQSVTVSSEGAGQIVSGTAVDQAGNSSAPASVTLNIDQTPPLIIATPSPAPNAALWNNSDVTVSFTCSDSLSGVVACPPPTVITSEGANQSIPVTVSDVAGNVASPDLKLNIDKTPPTIVQLLTPDQISVSQGGLITVTATDNVAVAQVVISVNGTTLASFTSAPFQANLTAPAGANPGDILTVTAVATDIAGNSSAPASHAVRISADGGVIVGQVLDDATSLPLQKASVQVISATGFQDQTDDHGRYSLPPSTSHLFLSISGPTTSPTTTVEREVFTSAQVGTVPVDARLTSLAPPITPAASGGSLIAGSVTVTVPAGAAPAGTSFQLTALSGQGLPGMLPLGWSPLAAFDLRASAPATGLTASISNLSPSVVEVATYDFGLHAWTLVADSVPVNAGTISIPVPSTGNLAVVVPDPTDPPIPIPAVGAPLTGVAIQPIQTTSTTSGSLNPPVLPASGGTAIATLGVASPAPLPSGTVLQANLTESFSLRSGQAVSEDSRPEDIIIYTAAAPANTTAGAQFAVTPSHKFTNGELLTGKVHLDIMAGREGVHGTPGGSDPVTLSDGVATLSVPGGALAQNTAISVQTIPLEDYIPTTGSMNALGEVLVDFSGQMLNTPAQLSISAASLNPADSFMLAKVERIDGVPHLVTAALSQISGTSLISVASPGLPGVLEGGEYVFYDLTGPIGFITGTVSSTAGPIAGTFVSTDSLPLGYITGANGQYTVPALVTLVTVSAIVPDTPLAGSGQVQTIAGQSVALNLSLVGTATAATISPANGSLGVPVSTIITITASAPLDPSQVNLSLSQGTNPINLQPFVLSQSGTILSFAPVSNLTAGTQYTVSVSGLRDTFQNPVVVPSSTFTTKSVQVPTFDPNAITFSFPDANGNIHVSALPGSLTPGSRVLIVDQNNGVVLSLTAINDGSISGDLQGSVDDLLNVSVTDPSGNTTTFARSQFVALDGTTAVGAAGGTVTGPGGVQLLIPAGALDHGVSFKIESFGPDAFTERPDDPIAQFGGGLRVTTSATTAFKAEVKLAFPKPAGASDQAFYWVYRRIASADGRSTAFEMIDEAALQGTGPNSQIITNSPPFQGYSNPWGVFSVDATGNSTLQNLLPITSPIINTTAQTTEFLLEYAEDITQSLKTQHGTVTGRVVRPQPVSGSSEPVFVGVPDATIELERSASSPSAAEKLLTRTDSTGVFAIVDPTFVGGTVKLRVTTQQGDNVEATAFEVAPTDSSIEILNIINGLFSRYSNVAYARVALQPLAPAAPAPALQVLIYQVTPTGDVLANGFVPVNTPLHVVVRVTTSDSPALSISSSGGDVQIPLQLSGSDSAGAQLYTGNFTPDSPITYTATARFLGAAPITATTSFRAIPPGGGSDNPVDGAPQVISSSPKDTEDGVDPAIAPQISFSEPVKNIGTSSAMLFDVTAAQAVSSLTFSGIQPGGAFLNTIDQSTKVTSIIIHPPNLLTYGHTYQIVLNSQIGDFDLDASGNPAPNQLSNTVITFSVATPAAMSQTPLFASPGLFVSRQLGNVFVEQVVNNLDGGNLAAFDYSDLANLKSVLLPFVDPQGIPSFGANPIKGLPFAIAGQDQSALVDGQPLIAVATGSSATPRPSNIFLYSPTSLGATRVLNTRVMQWDGAVSATNSPLDGVVVALAMKDNLLFTATFRRGVQVIDLQQAMLDFGSLSNSTVNPLLFLDLYTEGRGSDATAVVNSIPVGEPDQEFNAFIRSIKAGDFVTANGTETWVIGTGYIFDQNNPAADGKSYVAVNPTTGAKQALAIIDANGNRLVRGVALAITQIQDPISQKTSNVAVLGGTGNINGQTNVGVAAVLINSDPMNPTVAAMLGIDAPPTDVAIDGTTAAIATQSRTFFFDISNPSQPVPLGAADVGGKLAYGEGGILFSTDFVPGQLQDPSGGLHAVTFATRASVIAIAPVLATLEGTDPTDETAPRRNLVKFSVTPRIFPSTIKVQDTAIVEFKANGQTFLTKTFNPNQQPSLDFDAKTFVAPSKSFTATVTYTNLIGKNIVSPPEPITFGIIKVLADLNNDGKINQSDDSIRRQEYSTTAASLNCNAGTDPSVGQHCFGFWQSDPSMVTTQGTFTGVSDFRTTSAQEAALLDYATLQIHAEALPPVGTSIGLELPGTIWAIAPKVTNPDDFDSSQPDRPLILSHLLASKKYISDSTGTSNQLATLNNANSLCNSGGTTVLQGECLPAGVNSRIELTNLAPGDLAILFRCMQCPVTGSDAQHPTGQRRLALVFKDENSQSVELDHVNMDIRPVPQWMALLSAWPQNSGSNLPPQQLQPVSGWLSKSPVPNAHVTVLVHGFNVDVDEAQNRWIPATLKRLYWSGHPVLPVQRDPSDQLPSFTAGVTWNGNIGGSLAGYFYFPDDVFSALQSGAPLSRFLQQLKAPDPGTGQPQAASIKVLGHSLGNVVVNSALNQPDVDLSNHAIDVYVMNEPAVPAEAFYSSFTPDTTSTYWRNVGFHLQAYGYSSLPDSADGEWRREWLDMANPFCLSGGGGNIGCDPPFQDTWNAAAAAVQTGTAQHPDFQQRWVQTSTGRGPWTGFFAATSSKTTLYNTWSSQDCVLNYLFPAESIFALPAYSRGGIASLALLAGNIATGPPPIDPVTGMVLWNKADLTVSEERNTFWATLWNTDQSQDILFTGTPGVTHWNTTREWAELAYWFPSIAGAAGRQRLSTADGLVKNADFSVVSAISACPAEISNKITTGSTLSHSYLFAKPVHESWCALKRVRNLFDPNTPDPDPLEDRCPSQIPPTN